ncbi:MAG: bifunctional enoyl-CoA hydratase/phosphate acetyltransferase [Acetobacter fabarum]|uniref:bifunctional enoyl-CoA hydratase/phosphate acetyltransferase n=1 Tax=Acetobacter fabarum TaxID=483199 RepID=UPI00390A07DD|nr:bifunctional enoyl-CoA hydratase/phosphate acetyltransferase [Acetobacter fabarum]MCI1908121.1 bifunctional enoyl-CoA hydratase/phosphate acetyltransferase [Acetobacter fabarum]MCI1927168.1 bifunctional enoyl-CoA hydratase/phosphate acetyltransferase [Acetobacter fabarum]MCI1947168.1 bifunctional enoyl-CoA hydratase/phosphate acetyltransferase [Acetobacter fabarum]MCI1987610.1 bifunctional enoyl-CoA hydratase/phosphate acetyltransferase [Acetobacter fabarum]
MRHTSPLFAGAMPPPRQPTSHQLFADLINRALAHEPVPYGLVWPCEDHALAGPLDAAQKGIILPVLIGDMPRIQAIACKNQIDLSPYQIIPAPTPEAAAQKAVELARTGHVQGLIKGSLHTDTLMHAVVSPTNGLCTSRRISHVFLLAVPGYEKLLFVTDAAINIFPDLSTKRDIVQNAIDLHTGLGLGVPKVAILSAVEVINPKIPSTVDAASLCKMAERGQITGGMLDGPLGMDNAIDPEAARIKNLSSPVAGQAQILVTPDLEAGNMLAKNLIFMAQADSAGIALGAKVPIVLTSRADSVQARLASAAIGALYARHLAQQNTAF